MSIYKRDFLKLTEEELTQADIVNKAFEETKNKLGITTGGAYLNYLKNLPPAVFHYRQLFPNNFLNHFDLCNFGNDHIIKDFQTILNDTENTGEREILNYINQNNYFFIIGSVFDHYSFGHHKAFLFKEFKLGQAYIVDYLLIGKNSGGYEFIFVELEDPNKKSTLKNGEFGDSIRRGINQISDWSSWIDSNFQHLSPYFNSIKSPIENLPPEFYQLDKNRIHFVLVTGRRSHYNGKTYQRRLKIFNESKIKLIHYDNLIDLSNRVIGKSTY